MTKPGYIKTELGWIPNEWEVKELNSLGTFLKGKGISREEIRDIGLPCIRYGEIYTTYDNYFSKAVSFIDEASAKESQLVNQNDLLFSGSGESAEEIGKCIAYLGNQNIYAGGDIIILRPDSGNSKYLSFILNHKTSIKQKSVLGQGHSVVHIYPHTLGHVKIPLPTLPEQKKIAEILSTWDKAIEKYELLVKSYEKLKKGLMQKLLTGKLRFKEFEGENWRTFQLKDIFDRVTRRNTEKNSTIVTISAQRGFVRQEDFFNKIVASDILDNYYLVYKGEFCYNKSYCNGYDWGATKRLNDFEKAVVTTLYICFKFHNEHEHSGDFFEHFFEANLLNEGLTQIAHEGGRAHGLLNVTPNDFFNLKIQIPDLKEQIKIAKLLNSLSNEIIHLTNQLEALKQQKKGLMQKLLTGEVRVKVDQEESYESI